MISVIEDDYQFKLKLLFRKTIPSNEIFYLILFLLKYIPLILFTHGLDCNMSSNVFSLSKIFKSILIFHHSFSFSYVFFAYVVYGVVLFLLISFFFIYYKYYIASKSTDNKRYGIPLTKIEISKGVKYFFKFASYFYMLVIMCYQHLFEILFFGVFREYSTKITDMNPDRVFKDYEYHEIYAIVNIVFMVLLFLIMYMFFVVSTSTSISNCYGFIYSFSKLGVFFNVILYSLQGVYSTSFFYTESFKENYLMIMCYISVGLIAMKIIYTFKEVNYLGGSILLRFVCFVNNFCFVSGITEIVIYHVISDKYKVQQGYYFVTLLFDLINGYILTLFIEKIQTQMSFKNLALNIFVSNKYFQIESLFEFFMLLKTMGKGKNRFLVILDLIEAHQVKCVDEKCRCHKFMKYLASVNNKEKVDKLINKILYIGEMKITELILNKNNDFTDSISKLLFLHCDFLYSIKENLAVTLYLCQYYLIKSRNEMSYYHAYMIYEINYLTMKNIKKRDRGDKKSKMFLKENLLLEKIMKIIMIMCNNIEMLLHLKNIKNTNSKMLFSCEDILYPLIEFVEKNKELIGFINDYTKKHIYELSIEVKFLLYYYSHLFNTQLPNRTARIIYNGKHSIPSYDEFEKINLEKFIEKKNALILFLTHENKFIVRYTSTEINDILLFKRNELLGVDFNETLIPNDIADYHTIYMKEFILMGNTTYSKCSFLLNKDNQLIPMRINCITQPTLSSLYTFVVNVEVISNQNFKNYYIMSDMKFNLWSISQSFENQFFFSVKMMNSLNINFCDFFGVNKDKLNEYFKTVKFPTRKLQKKQISALTSIKNEEMFIYDTMDINWFQTDAQKEIDFQSVKLIIVGKEKFVNSLLKLEKNIEELGLESEWKLRINELYNKLKIKVSTSDDYSSKQTANIMAASQNNATDVFYIKYHFKKIGQIQYYVCTISEYIEDQYEISNVMKLNDYNITIAMSTEKEVTPYLTPDIIPSAMLPKSLAFNRKFHMNTTNSFSTTANLNSVSDNASSLLGTSSTNLMGKIKTNKVSKKNLIIKQEPDIPEIIPKDDIKKNKATMDRLNKGTAKLIYFKLFESFCLFVIFMLNIGTFIYNQTSLNVSINLFNINAYSFLLANDVFYGSMATLNLCLLKDGIQTGDVDNLHTKIQQSAKDLMSHYQLLNIYTTKMIKEAQTREIYQLLNEETEYSYIVSNWEEKKTVSSLVGEIYQIHYWLRTFNTDETDDSFNYCRISEYFFSNSFNDIRGTTDILATNEEKFIYYVCSNVVSTISMQLENLTKLANVILRKENKRAKMGSLAINVSIIIVALIVFVVVMINLQTSRRMFRGKMEYLFTKHTGEEIFFEDIGRFKQLLECFSKSECNDYTAFKQSIVDFNEDNKIQSQEGNKYNMAFTSAGLAKSSILNIKSGIFKQDNADEKKSRRMQNKNKLKVKNIKHKKTEEEIEKEEELENKIELTNNQFAVLANPRYATIAFIIVTLIFVLFLSIEISGLVLSSRKFDGLMIENEFATNFLNRGPKLNELVLYSIISVILNDVNYISREPDKYKDFIVSNYFDISMELDTNSIFTSLKESDYAYLYYQIYIIRTNIRRFISAKNLYMYLKKTTENEYLFDDGENFCACATLQYVQHYYNDEISEEELLSKVNEEAKQCRQVGNGMNLNGYKAGLDLMLQQLDTLYLTFTYEETNYEARQWAFLKSSDLKIIEDNLLNVIRSLHFADSFLVIEDINNSYDTIHRVKIYFSIASIGISCVIISIILFILLFKLDYYNEVLAEIVLTFDKTMINYV